MVLLRPFFHLKASPISTSLETCPICHTCKSTIWMMSLDAPPSILKKYNRGEVYMTGVKGSGELLKKNSPRPVKSKEHYPGSRSPLWFIIPKKPWASEPALRKCAYDSLIKHWFWPNSQTQLVTYSSLDSNLTGLFPKIKLSHQMFIELLLCARP